MRVVLLMLLLLPGYFLSAQSISFYQDQFNGGITTGGYSPSYSGGGTGTITLSIAPGSTIRKAYLLAGRQGQAPNVAVSLNGSQVVFNSGNQASPVFQSPNYGGSSAVHAADVTGIVSAGVNTYTLVVPTQNSTVNRYNDFYLFVAYNNAAMAQLNTGIFLNTADMQDSISYTLNTGTSINNQNPVALAMFLGYVCDIINDNENISVNGTILGDLGGNDFNSELCGGPAGCFVYQNNTLTGLGDDDADQAMYGADALSNIQALVPACSNSVVVTCNHGMASSPNDNAVWAMVLAWTEGAAQNGHKSDTTVCANTPVQLNIAGTGGLTWNTTAGLSCTNCNNPVATVAGTTNYIATYNGTCGTVADTFGIIVANIATLDILNNDTTLCSGDSLQLMAVASGNISWNPSTTLSCSNCNNPIAEPIATATYTASTGNGGCMAFDSIIITITAAAAVTAANDTTICSGQSVQLSAAGNGPFNWLPAAGLSCTNCSNPVVSPLATTAYYVSSGTGNCLAFDSVKVIVNSSPAVAITLAPDTICAHDTALVCAPAGFAAYQWNSGGTTNCINAMLAGNYYVTVTDANNCTAESNHSPLTVRPVPPVSVTVQGDTLTSFGAVSYQWLLNGTPIAGATSAVWVATAGGLYSVAIVDANGCTSTSNAVVISSIDNLTPASIQIYPNPATTEGWNIYAAKEYTGALAEIYDSNGRLVYRQLLAGFTTTVGQGLAKGAYLLKISAGAGTQVFKLLMW